jgi:hypothetical protein
MRVGFTYHKIGLAVAHFPCNYQFSSWRSHQQLIVFIEAISPEEFLYTRILYHKYISLFSAGFKTLDHSQ